MKVLFGNDVENVTVTMVAVDPEGRVPVVITINPS
jgi:hypothetical protein